MTEDARDEKKTIIYPFNDALLPVIPHLAVPDMALSISKAVDPGRQYLSGKDIGHIKNQPLTGICISDNLDDALNHCDVLLYMDENHERINDESAVMDMEKAIRLQKTAVCLRKLPGSKVKELRELAAKTGGGFHYLGNALDGKELVISHEVPFELYAPNASIIMVGETVKGLDGEHIALSLAAAMKAMGYHCVTILEDKYTRALHAIPYPSFLRALDTAESDKVYYLNNFLRLIDETENPDLIIFHLPEPMMKFNELFGNGFGIIPYLVSQAVQPDCFILCTQFGDIGTRFFDSLSVNFESRFGYGIDFIHMANMAIDTGLLRATGKVKLSHYPQAKLDSLISSRFMDSRIPVFNGMNREQCAGLVQAVRDKLAGYGENGSILG